MVKIGFPMVFPLVKVAFPIGLLKIFYGFHTFCLQFSYENRTAFDSQLGHDGFWGKKTWAAPRIGHLESTWKPPRSYVVFFWWLYLIQPRFQDGIQRFLWLSIVVFFWFHLKNCSTSFGIMILLTGDRFQGEKISSLLVIGCIRCQHGGGSHRHRFELLINQS